MDSGSEDEEEPLSLEALRAILEDEDSENPEDPEETETPFSFDWSRDYNTYTGQPEVYSQAEQCGPNIEGTDPLELFTHVWDQDIMKTIEAETNQYAWETIVQASESGGISSHSRLNDWVETSIDELYKLFGVMILMSLTVRKRVSEYWSTGVLGMPGFRGLMSIKRYWLLMRFLHFANNNTISIRGPNRKIAKYSPSLTIAIESLIVCTHLAEKYALTNRCCFLKDA